MTAVILALIAGAVVGLALGGLGGGGSMLAVPALIYLLGLTPGTATTASLLIVAVTSLTGLVAHARAGRVRWRSGLLFGAAGLPFAALGGALSRHLPGPALTAAFALLAGLAAWRMLSAGRRTAGRRTAGRRTAGRAAAAQASIPAQSRASAPDRARALALPDGTSVHGTEAEPATETGAETETENAFPLPAEHARQPETDTEADATSTPAPVPASARRSALAGAGLGAATGVLGVGGGFLAVPALVSFLAFSMADAIGTSLLVITLNSLSALLPRLGGAADIPWAVVGPFAAAAILGAWDGKRLASKLSGRTLQRIFATALLAVAALMLVDAVL
ncbi:sulfite exporter TauE/SafE family protein [Kitasatospora sp. NPDC059795]|uniref:sulfite exporter TauE/SafE family protein n=1 Tax=Kitasatospora sp. NPDC059795 TaxID=3346949 RepID=UPI0036652717